MPAYEPGASVNVELDRMLAAAAGQSAGTGREVRAIRHPLGFVCLPAWRLADLGVCVHVWTPLVESVELTTSPVHCHSWDLTSIVLYGTICNERIDVFDTDDSPTHRVFEVEQNGNVDEIRPTARLVRYRVGTRQLSRPGEVYRMPAGAFHSTVVPTVEAATLVFGWSRPGGADRSIGPIDLQSHRLQRRYCDDDESALAVRIVAERLDKAGAMRLVDGLEGLHESIT